MVLRGVLLWGCPAWCVGCGVKIAALGPSEVLAAFVCRVLVEKRWMIFF